jgi:intracellular septation protein
MKPQGYARWKPVVEFGPLLAFFICFYAYGLKMATLVLIITASLGAAVHYAATRKLWSMPLVSALFIAVMGGLTLALNDERFLKLRPTVVNGLLAALMFICWFKDFPLLKKGLGSNLPLREEAWRPLTLRFGLLFTLIAGVNEYIWRHYPTEIWVNFKVFGVMGMMLAFMLINFPFLMKHMEEQPAQK